MSRGSFSDDSLSRSSSEGSTATGEGLYEQQEPLIRNSVAMEKSLQRKSIQMRDQQHDWQVCFPLSFFHSYLVWQISPFAFDGNYRMTAISHWGIFFMLSLKVYFRVTCYYKNKSVQCIFIFLTIKYLMRFTHYLLLHIFTFLCVNMYNFMFI